ncbi:hypothetical protein FRB99_007702 [Tulasnella sp. 403]|nr:hypothetical protein FRB99_007702 [Tulasnella sp. 403]
MFTLFPLLIVAFNSFHQPVAAVPTIVTRGVAGCRYQDQSATVTLPVDLIDPTTNQKTGTSQLRLKYLSSGDNGCVYDVEGGWTDPWYNSNEAAVAKSLQLNPIASQKQDFDEEKTALHAIQELFAVAQTNQGDDQETFLIMLKQDGKEIFQTEKYREEFPDFIRQDGIMTRKQCEGFMNNLYGLIADKKIEYTRYGYLHTDMNWRNFLFNDDLTEVNLIDWGMSEKFDNKNRQVLFSDLRDDIILSLAHASTLPIDDIHDSLRKSGIQGICGSQLRSNGAKFTGNGMQLPEVANTPTSWSNDWSNKQWDSWNS